MIKTILVVDDSQTMRQQLKNFLEDNGFNVIEGENGAQGTHLAEDNDVDLMIVDINMPVMNGFEMMERVRQMPNHATTPIFVFTTESSHARAEQGKKAGATAWIVKPFDPQTLLKGIKKMLKI